MHNKDNNQYEVSVEEFPLKADFPVFLSEHNPPSQPISNVHFHPFFEVGYCESGSGIFIVDHELIPFCVGDVMIIFENQLHRAQSTTGGSNWAFIYVDVLNLLHDLSMSDLAFVGDVLQNGLNYYNVTRSRCVADTVLQLITELAQTKENYQSHVRALVWRLMLQIDREMAKEIPDIAPKKARKGGFSKIAPALEFISDNYDKKITTQMLADHAFMSSSSMRREFIKILQMSPLEYISSIRVKMATILLRTSNRSFGDIALEAGFGSLTSFNRTFRTYMKCTPGAYRNKINQEMSGVKGQQVSE